jgi:hypothetical protein
MKEKPITIEGHLCMVQTHDRAGKPVATVFLQGRKKGADPVHLATDENEARAIRIARRKLVQGEPHGQTA